MNVKTIRHKVWRDREFPPSQFHPVDHLRVWMGKSYFYIGENLLDVTSTKQPKPPLPEKKQDRHAIRFITAKEK